MNKLPFKLITNDQDRPSTGRHVVEVHPAVALWRWCWKKRNGLWTYKKTNGKECRSELEGLMHECSGLDFKSADDDELDARMSWYLARCWLDKKGAMLLGNEQTGTFLLPVEPELKQAFEKFVLDRRTKKPSQALNRGSRSRRS
jgi:hypothetical protein